MSEDDRFDELMKKKLQLETQLKLVTDQIRKIVYWHESSEAKIRKGESTWASPPGGEHH